MRVLPRQCLRLREVGELCSGEATTVRKRVTQPPREEDVSADGEDLGQLRPRVVNPTVNPSTNAPRTGLSYVDGHRFRRLKTYIAAGFGRNEPDNVKARVRGRPAVQVTRGDALGANRRSEGLDVIHYRKDAGLMAGVEDGQCGEAN